MEISELIAEIDKEIWLIKKDTNRGISGLWEWLISLSKKYGEARRDYQKSKTSYDLDYIKAKEDREQDLKRANELIADEKKQVKITDAELERYAKSTLTKDYQTMQDFKVIEVYLEPILEQYNNYVNWIKFDKKDCIMWEKFYFNNN